MVVVYHREGGDPISPTEAGRLPMAIVWFRRTVNVGAEQRPNPLETKHGGVIYKEENAHRQPQNEV